MGVFIRGKEEPGLIPTRTYGDFGGRECGIVCDPVVEVVEIGTSTAWLTIMSDGVSENLTTANIAGSIAASKGTAPASQKIVEEAKRKAQQAKKHRDDTTTIVVQFHHYGKGKDWAANAKQQNKKKAKDKTPLTDEELIMQSIQVCQEAMDQGVHEDDVLDVLRGISPEIRAKVQAELKKIARSSTRQSVAGGSPNLGSQGSGKKQIKKSMAQGGGGPANASAVPSGGKNRRK